MKEVYLGAEMTVVEFQAADVITTSFWKDKIPETTWWDPYGPGGPDFNAFDGQ